MNYTIFRRIIGLEIIPPRIELDKETVLVQLSEKELNERMPCLSMLEIGMPYLDLTQHPVELRCVVTQPVKDVDLEFLYPSDETKSKLLERCEIVLTTLLLTKTGMLELGPYSFKLLLEEDLFEQFTMNKQFVLPVYPSKIIIDKEDVELLKSSYIAATKICQEASVIHYALKRFILGSKRVNPEDKLIDYVIAWESLLLTVDGKQVKGELSYRFGLNGSSLLHWIPDGLSREDAFILMRAAYECRSIIVHRGGNQKELKKTLSKVQVATVEELSDLLGKYLRKTILWMANIEENKRPYKERGGWEKLLWSNPA